MTSLVRPTTPFPPAAIHPESRALGADARAPCNDLARAGNGSEERTIHGSAPSSLATALRGLATEGDGCRILERHLACEARINRGHPLVPGNAVTLLQNGPDTYQAMFEAIGQARDHINLETYIFDDGEIGQRFAAALSARCRSGVRVNLIYDSVGTLGVPASFFDSMREAGIRLLEFHPVNPALRNSRLLRINNRDHRKLMVVDGDVAFIGGINISDTYSSVPTIARLGSGATTQDDATKDEGGWRDTHLRVQGPAVAQFQQLLAEAKEQSALPLERHAFYERAGQAFAIFRTGEARTYGNLLLRKGVVA